MQKVIDLLASLLSDESLLAGTISNPRDKKSPVTKICECQLEIEPGDILNLSHS